MAFVKKYRFKLQSCLVMSFVKDEKKSFEDLIYELFEFISVLKDKNKFKPTIKRAIDELCYYAILYMQINDDQVRQF